MFFMYKIYKIYKNGICIFDGQVEHILEEPLFSKVGFPEEMAAAEYGEAQWGTVWASGSALSWRLPCPEGCPVTSSSFFLTTLHKAISFFCFLLILFIEAQFHSDQFKFFQWKTICFYSMDLSAKPSLVNGRQWLNFTKVMDAV